MNEYAFRIGPVKYIANLFRRLFTVPFFERFLVKQIERSRNPVWKKLVPPGYLYKPGSLRRTTINGLSFLLDISNVVENLVYFRKTPENFKPVEALLRGANVIFDVGANIGETALLFAQQAPQAQIFSFEPHPETYNKALTNIGLNAFANIRLFNLGMGAASERLKLYQVTDHNPGMNRILPGEQTYPFTWVDIVTLDGFCTQHGIVTIDFLKVDVEGFEYSVLEGGKNIVAKTHPLIYLELYDHGLKRNGHSASALIALLYELGYNKITNAYTLSPVHQNTNLTDCDIDIIAERIVR